MRFCLLLILLFLPVLSWAQDFPVEWWKEVPRSEAASWEILPQEAVAGSVILSKRTELGIFSNFGPTPFILSGKAFGSIEGLWQSLKYPDPLDANDPRHAINEWPFTRAQVELMDGFAAKAASEAAKKIYTRYQLKNVSWLGYAFDYRDFAQGSDFHYQLIVDATRAKLDQHPELWTLLLKTKCLKLLPDHKPAQDETAAYHYYAIYMKLRNEKLTEACELNER